MKVLFALATTFGVAACSSSTERPTAETHAPGDPPAPVVGVTSPSASKPSGRAAVRARPIAMPPRTIHSIPGGEPELLAVTDNGSAAATADASGALRLWPRLDGTLEPVVIAAPRPVALALARGSSASIGDSPAAVGGSFAADLAIATLDAAGVLDIIRTTARGDHLSHVRIDAPRPFTRVVAAEDAFVALADDGSVQRFELDGTPVASPAATQMSMPPFAATLAQPGSRVLAITARGGHVIALVDRSGELHAVDLATLDETGAIAIDPATVVISPDGRRLAANDPTRDHTLVIELATGVTTTLTAPDGWPSHLEPIGFTTNRELYLGGSDTASTVMWTGTSRVDDFVRFEGDLFRPPTVAADNKMIASMFREIVVHAGGTTKYLGYAVAQPTLVTAAGDGWLLDGGFETDRGGRVAELHGGRLRLRDRSGKARWAIDAHGATSAVWTTAGELMLVGGGAARVDVATGELRDRQCGWQFGLRDDHNFAQSELPLLCDAP